MDLRFEGNVLTVKVVIAGDGKVGYALAEQLSREGHAIVVIDNNREVLRGLSEKLDVMVVSGNGASIVIQREAGVEDADLVIAATSTDEVNILCCIVARKLGCKNTIARVRNPEYAEQLQLLKQELGLSMTINPELTAAREIFKLLQLPAFLQRNAFAKGRAEIVEIELKAGNPLIGVPLGRMQAVTKVKSLICAIQSEDGGVVIPDGSAVCKEGDCISVTAPTHDLVHLIKSLGLERRKIKDVLLIGGSRIAHYLSAMLVEAGIHVKIIENNPARCLELAEALPKVSVVEGDGTDRSVLLAEGIESMDAVVTLTNIDEENLFVSMYASRLSMPKVITKINRTEYTEMLAELGIDSIVNPKLLCAYNIIQYVRAMGKTTGGSVLTVYDLVGDRVQALEFNVAEGTRHLSVPLKHITLKPQTLIACINRRGQILIPGGGDTIETGDSVVVVASADRDIYDLNDIFD